MNWYYSAPIAAACMAIWDKSQITFCPSTLIRQPSTPVHHHPPPPLTTEPYQDTTQPPQPSARTATIVTMSLASKTQSQKLFEKLKSNRANKVSGRKGRESRG